MFRSLAKTCVACGYAWSGAGRWFNRTDRTATPFIVGYHRVVENFKESARRSIPSMLIAAETFEKQLDWIGRRFRFVSLDDVGFHLENERRFSTPVAAITFDDGYADVYQHAFPILKRKGIPAAVFVVTEFVGTRQLQLHDRLYSCLAKTSAAPFSAMTRMLTSMPQSEILKRIEGLERGSATLQRPDEFLPLSWQMIEEMQRSGITIGSHTKSHVLLTSEDLAEAQKQLMESKQTLETRLKQRVDHFAYPDGRFNASVVQAVRAAGYRFAYTICGRRNSSLPLFTIPRKVLWEKACINVLGRFSPAVMQCQANGIFDARLRCEHAH